MLLYDPYLNIEDELNAQIRECMKELGYDVDDECDTEQPVAPVTVH